MDAAAWNRTYPPGTRVSVTKANGDVLWTWTSSEAQRVGQLDFIELQGRQGLWLLNWCAPLDFEQR